jgi:hypothetical protein
MIVLLPFRYYQFKQKNEELYLLDFCYFGGAYYSAFGTGIALFRVTTGIKTWLVVYVGRPRLSHGSTNLTMVVCVRVLRLVDCVIGGEYRKRECSNAFFFSFCFCTGCTPPCH